MGLRCWPPHWAGSMPCGSFTEYEASRQNYTLERDEILPDWDAAEMVRRMKTVAQRQ